MSTTTSAARHDRGAAAVALALVLPILIMLVFGIIEFGRFYNAQVQLTGAAREGARIMVIKAAAPSAQTDAKNAAEAYAPECAVAPVCTYDPNPINCTAGSSVTYRVKKAWVLDLPPFIKKTFDVEGKAVMKCEG